jgi:hypothetical protein
MTDIWFRNAQACMSVCAEEGVTRLTWTRQHLSRLRNDGILYVRQFYMHTPIRPKIMHIGVQGASEYHIFSKITEPTSVWPVWSGKGDTWDDLIDLIEKPWGESKKICSDISTLPALRPTYGQKHRIVIHNSPAPISGVGQQFWATLAQVQADYPEVELFVNGTMSYAVLFGLKFRACDFGLSDAGDTNSQLYLPNGMKIKLDKGEVKKLYQWEDWLKLLGFKIDELVRNENNSRFRLKIRSARWAAKHWATNYRFFKNNQNIAVDSDASDADFEPRQSHAIVLRRKHFTLKEADKILCNRCRIAPGCKAYRQDSICGLTGSTMAELAKYFDSRNAGRIIEGLAYVTRLQAQRLEASMDNEANSGDVDPEVTKQMNALFANGVKLAKLVDPKLAGPGVQVNVGVNNGDATVVSMTNPKELMANIVNALEGQGIPRDQITPDMVEGVLKGMTVQPQHQAIEAQAIAVEDVLGKKKPEKVSVGKIIDMDPLPLIPVARDDQ